MIATEAVIQASIPAKWLLCNQNHAADPAEPQNQDALDFI
jgi:hypothetical protein